MLPGGGGRAPSSKTLSRAALTSVPQPTAGAWRCQAGRQAIEEEEVRAELGHPAVYPGFWPTDAPPGQLIAPPKGRGGCGS